MEELSLVSPYWPMIFVVGNHERQYEKSLQIFQVAFDVFGQFEEERVEAFQFWQFKIIVFDPYF